MTETYGNGQMLHLSHPKTTHSDVWRTCYNAAREGSTAPLERQIRVNWNDTVWGVHIGYWNGVSFFAYRFIEGLKTWADVERVVDNHTKNYKGRIKVLGFDAGNRILDTPGSVLP